MYYVHCKCTQAEKKSTSFIDFLGITRMHGALELSVLLHHQHLRISCVYINIGCNRTQNFLPPHNNIQPHPLQTFHKEYYIFDWLNQGIDKIGRFRKTGIQNAIFKSTIMVIKNMFMIHSIICGLF